MNRPTCQARVNSAEFGRGRCCNWAKAERFGLHVCNVHKKMIDRLAVAHGEEYALAIVWHEWQQKAAAFPRVRPEVMT